MENFQEELIKALSNLKSFVPVGTPWWGFDVKAKPIGVQLYQGQVLARDMYPVHWNYIQSYRTIVSDAEWHTYAEAHNGMCPYFSYGDEVGTYRMPKIVDIHPRFSNIDIVGTYVEAGIPNITGDFNTEQQLGLNDNTQGTGAFYSINQNTTKYTTVGSSTATRLSGFAFDASRSSHIYGQSDTVQPPAINMIVGEYVVSGISEIDIVTANEITKGLDALQTEVGKVIKEDRLNSILEKYNTAYITETWNSGTNWYRKWSDGWIEQGGYIKGTSNNQVVTITLPKSFSDLTYHVSVNFEYTVQSTAYYGYLCAYSKTTSTFKTIVYKDNVNYSTWYACGY